jgi:hypothetical protein
MELGHASVALQPYVGPGRYFGFVILYTDDMIGYVR